MIYSHVISSYEKVLKTESFTVDSACLNLTALKGDTVSFQVVYYSDETLIGKVSIESPFGKHLLARSVEYVPATCPYRTVEGFYQDGNYERITAFECPDVLRNMRAGRLKITKGKYRTVRIYIDVPERFKAGDYTVKVVLENASGETLCVNEQKVKIYNAVLPKATLKHTEWFHTDCIADYYGYEVFSEKHWAAIESFMKTATKRGINLILTPMFTPPLDTQVGGERTTVQIIDVTRNGENWSFGFEKLDRWVALALKCGYEYFEISHLFTQWGANAAPKVMATVDGEYKRVFGWDTLVVDGEYPKFLSVCLPELTKHLRELGVADRCYFHISDEPSIEQIENYERCKKHVAPYIDGFKTLGQPVYPEYELRLGPSAAMEFRGENQRYRGLAVTPFDEDKSSLVEAWNASGRPYYDYDLYNTERLSGFAQLDLRIDKNYFFRNWRLGWYISLQNVTGSKLREQDAFLSTGIIENPSAPIAEQRYRMRTVKQETGSIIPSIGVTVEF